MAKIIHLEECDPEKHPEWTQSTTRKAHNTDDVEHCPQTQYMANELFPDETVWIEDRSEDQVGQERRLALGKVAYEEFASQRVALGNAMPPWQGGPSVTGGQGTELPETEREIWARVAEAVAAVIPFVITDEMVDNFGVGEVPGREMYVRSGLRAAALAAGFRVEER